MTNSNLTQNIRLTSNKIVYQSNDGRTIKILLMDILIIGEFTTDNGPFVDDWFLTIVTPNEIYNLSMYCNGIEEFLNDLSKTLNSEFNIQLANSANWNSRIIYPNNLKDQQLFELTDKRVNNLTDKIKKLIGVQERGIRLTATIEELRKTYRCQQ